MRLAPSLVVLPSALALATLAACGGSPPEPAEPAPIAKAEPEPAEEPAPAEAPKAEEKPAPAEEPARPSRSPQDIITEESVLFTLNFRASESGAKAEETCSKKHGDDDAKKAACITKASDAAAESIFFKQDGGKWWWTSIRRSGAQATVLHKFEVEFAEETDTSVTVVPKGRDTGKAPWAKLPAKIVLEVKDGSMVFVDPKHGRGVYDPRAGLVQ